MQLANAELFFGLHHGTLETLTAMFEPVRRRRYDRLFAAEDPAERFYILVEGGVALEYGPERIRIYHGHQPGEMFGWSAIIGRRTYSASAVCTEASRLVGIDRDRFWSVLRRRPDEELTFSRQLAAVLGHRLIETYRSMSARRHTRST